MKNEFLTVFSALNDLKSNQNIFLYIKTAKSKNQLVIVLLSNVIIVPNPS